VYEMMTSTSKFVAHFHTLLDNIVLKSFLDTLILLFYDTMIWMSRLVATTQDYSNFIRIKNGIEVVWLIVAISFVGFLNSLLLNFLSRTFEMSVSINPWPHVSYIL
jgi:hypothetical protein